MTQQTTPPDGAAIAAGPFSERVRVARLALGLSQKDCATRLAISAQHLCDLEYGRRDPSERVALAISSLLNVQNWTPYEVKLHQQISASHALLCELRRVVWAGRFGIPYEEVLRLHAKIDAVLSTGQEAGR